MITNYTISRISKTLYVVRAGDEIVKECGSFTEAQNYIFIAQSNELMRGVMTNKAA